jgi:hypothetical protein
MMGLAESWWNPAGPSRVNGLAEGYRTPITSRRKNEITKKNQGNQRQGGECVSRPSPGVSQEEV